MFADIIPETPQSSKEANNVLSQKHEESDVQDAMQIIHSHNQNLSNQITKMKTENTLLEKQNEFLSQELEHMRANRTRGDINLEYDPDIIIFQLKCLIVLFRYLKNLILQFLVTENVDQLLPIISQLLQLTPDEVNQIQSKYSGLSGFLSKVTFLLLFVSHYAFIYIECRII